MSAAITAQTRLYKVKNLPEFSEYRDFILPLGGWMGKLASGIKISTLAHLAKTWNPDSMAEGLCFLQQAQRKETVFYEIYSAEEKAADSSRKSTGLFAFPCKRTSPFVLIVPGGGYSSVASIVEGFPTAQKLNEMGYAAFVLHYRTGEAAHFPNPLEDLAKALSFILSNAERFRLDISNFALMGFSAGGHLVSNFAVRSTGYGKYALPAPNAVILSYPVISMGEITHPETRRNFLGKDESNHELQQKYSADETADANYPPTFLWCCEHDNTVPSENSKQMYRTLCAKGVPCTLKLYDSDAHGWGIAKDTIAENWLNEALEFWKGVYQHGNEQ